MTATMTDVGAPVAPCAGKWELFESFELADHQAAVALCAGCPIARDCAERLAACSTTQGGTYARGTWAGRFAGGTPTRGGVTAADRRLEEIYGDDEARDAWIACRAGDRGAWAVEGYRIHHRRHPYAKRAEDHDDLLDPARLAVAS